MLSFSVGGGSRKRRGKLSFSSLFLFFGAPGAVVDRLMMQWRGGECISFLVLFPMGCFKAWKFEFI